MVDPPDPNSAPEVCSGDPVRESPPYPFLWIYPLLVPGFSSGCSLIGVKFYGGGAVLATLEVGYYGLDNSFKLPTLYDITQRTKRIISIIFIYIRKQTKCFSP